MTARRKSSRPLVDISALIARYVLLWLATSFVCASTVFAWDEYAIVSGEHGYLLNSKGSVVDAVGTGHVFDVKSKEGKFLVVEHNGEAVKIDKRVCQRTSEWDFATETESEIILESLQLLQKSMTAERVGDSELALKLIRQSIESVDDPLGISPSPLHAWLLQFKAYIYYLQDDLEKAYATLDICDTELKQLGMLQHNFFADSVNTRGIILVDEGRYAEAIELHQQAVEISTAVLGETHVDCAILHSNLAYALESDGDYDSAISSQQAALEIKKAIYPASAVEIVRATNRLGDLLRDNEQYAESIKYYESALRNMVVYHPHLLFEVADTRENLAYSNRLLGNYEAAEKACRDLQKSLLKFEPADELTYRKHVQQRLGLLDFEQEDYEAALAHFERALELGESNEEDVDDGFSLEFAGDALVQLGRTDEARAAYEVALEIYTATEGPESENLLTVNESLAALLEQEPGSLDSVAMVATPQGYLLDEEDRVIAEVPGLSVLKWLAAGDSYHEVEYDGQVGRINNNLLHLGSQIPGYGQVSAESLRAVTEEIGQVLTALQVGDQKSVLAGLEAAKELCDAEDVQGSTLDLWQQVMALGVEARMNGPEGILPRYNALQSDIESLDAEDYPVNMDVGAATAFLLGELDQLAASRDKQAETLGIAAQYFDSDHAVVQNALARFGKAAFAAGDSQGAIKAFAQASEIARRIYPPKAVEIGESVNDLSIALTQSEQYDEAAKLLEALLQDYKTLPKDVHAFSLATLGKVYAAQGNTEGSRKLLSTVIRVLSQHDDTNNTAGLLAFSELGKLEIAAENWQSAIDLLKQAVKANRAIDNADSFAGSELHRLLASAYKGADDVESAAAELNRVLEIYDGLGGANSPQAAEIRSELESLGVVTETPAEIVAINSYFNFSPDGQEMLVTNEKCQVLDDPQSNFVLAEFDAKERLWSLELRDGYHRVYVPEQEQYGWIEANAVSSQHDLLLEKALDELNAVGKRSSFAKKDIATVLDTFRQGDEAGFTDAAEEMELVEQALALLKRRKLDANYVSAILMGNLIRIYEESGQVAKAASINEEQLSPLLSTVGYYHPFVVANRMRKATHFRRLGEYFKELSEAEECVRICEKRFGPNDSRTFGQLMTLAACNMRKGYFESARKVYEGHLSLDWPQGTQPSLTIATSRLGLAGLDASIGNFASAMKHAEKSLEELDSIGHPIPDLTSRAIALLAHCVGQNGELEEALGILGRAEELASRAAPEQKLAILLHKSTIASYAEQPASALEFANEADEFAQLHFGENHFRRHDALQALGRALHRVNPLKAAGYYDQARRLCLEYLNETVAFEDASRQISFAHTDRRWLDESLSLALAKDNLTPDIGQLDLAHGLGNSIAATETATWILNFHNILPRLLARKAQARALLQSQSEYNAYIGWDSASKTRARLPLFSTAAATEFNIEEIRSQLVSEEQGYLKGLSPTTRAILTDKLSWVTPNDIQKQLATDEAMVLVRRVQLAFDPLADPFDPKPPGKFDAHEYVAWLIPGRPDGAVQAFWLAEDSTIQPLAKKAMESIPTVKENQFRPSNQRIEITRAFSRNFQELSQKLWEPIYKRLPPGTRRLTLCVDDDLMQLPWAALTSSNGRAIIDDFTLRFVSSPRDLLDSAAAPETSKLKVGAPTMFIASSGTALDQDINSLFSDQIQILAGRTRGLGHPFTDKVRSQIFGSSTLPSGAKERTLLSGLGSAFNADPNVFSGEQSSEFRFFVTPNPKALHIASLGLAGTSKNTHRDLSFLLTESRMNFPISDDLVNPLIRCSLLMTGFSREGRTNPLQDGVLTGEEIVANDLRGTELVTLSQGVLASEEDDASEHAALLPQAFALAGAQAVVSPRWQLDEDSLGQFLKAFYQQLASGKDKAEALRAAQLQFRDSIKQRYGDAHPYYWAAFRLTGRP